MNKKLEKWKFEVDQFGADKSDCDHCTNHSHGNQTKTEEEMVQLYDVMEVMCA